MNSTGETPAESSEMIRPVLDVIRSVEAAEEAVKQVRAAARQEHEQIDVGGRLAEILLRLAEAKNTSYPHTPSSKDLNYLDQVKRDAARAYRRSEEAREANRQDRLKQGLPVPREPPLDQDRYDDLLNSVERRVDQVRESLATWNQRRGCVGALFFFPEGLRRVSLLADIGRLMRWVAELHGLTSEDIDGLQGLRHEDVDAGRQAEERGIEERLRFEAAEAVSYLQLPRRPTSAEAAVQALIQASPLSAREWDDSLWDDPQPPDVVGGDILLGRFHVAAPTVADALQPPATLRFPFRAGVFIDGTGAMRTTAVGLARSIGVRLLAAAPAGRIQFTFVDPVSLGRSVADFQHLADFGKKLVGVSTATRQSDIEERLAWLSAQVEKVNSTHLRGQFATIEEYNEFANEIAEPYHVLVVLDYPARFSESASQQLLSLAENGPPCGVHVIVVTDADREQPRSLPLNRLTLNQHRVSRASEPGTAGWQADLVIPGGRVQRLITPDADPIVSFDLDNVARSAAARLLVAVGRQAKEALESNPVTLARLLPVLNYVLTTGRSTGLPEVVPPVTIDAADPATWWRGSTAWNAVAPIGLTGVRDVTGMHFSSMEIANGALMMGVPRSGKSTALHAAILTMCMLYGPEELELYLIDSKDGVEFKIYDHLPHAKRVSIRSEREFSVSVLESICAEITKRANLMKERARGRTNITEYRKVTGDQLPRIVVVMDEFHQLFDEDDRIGQAAFRAFSDIAREGAFAGVHLVSVTQTLGATPALDKPTLQLLAQRIAFACRPQDAAIVMPDNPGPALLTGRGNGLFNPDYGKVAHNRPFRGLYINPDERDGIIAALAAKATESGWRRLPRVFEGDSAAARPHMVAATEESSSISIPVGEPFGISPAFAVNLRRESGANLILTGDKLDGMASDLPVRGALHSCILAATLAGAKVSVLDFIADGEQVKEGLTVREFSTRLGLDYAQSKGAPAVLLRYADLVAARSSTASYSARAHVLVIFGLQRANTIQAQAAHRAGEASSADPAVALASVLRRGPEVGVHAIVSCNGTHAVDQMLGRDVKWVFNLRIASDSSTPEDLSFTAGTPHATVARTRPNQLLVGDHATDTTTRVRGYPVLTAADIPDLGEVAHGQRES